MCLKKKKSLRVESDYARETLFKKRETGEKLAYYARKPNLQSMGKNQ